MDMTNLPGNSSAAELENSEYALLMNALHVGVSKHLLDKGLPLLWANDYFYEATGYTRTEYAALFPTCKDYFSKMPAEYDRLMTAIRQAAEEGAQGFQCVCRIPCKAGSMPWIKITGTFTKSRTGGRRVIYAVLSDITALVEQQELQRKLEERSEMLRNTLKMAERANQVKADFLSRMSHNLHTPMNAIMGMLSIAKRSLSNPEQVADCLEKAQASAKSLFAFINDILDMSKIESGKVVLNKKEFDFVSFVRNLRTLFETQAREKGLHFAIHAEGDLHETYNGDEGKLNQILMNLLDNAVKFTKPGGSVDLYICAGKTTANSHELIFIVRDTGPGMSQQTIDRIFLPFEQDSCFEDTNTSSGLGLPIAFNYARMMNGGITVESRQGEGSVFTVSVWLDTSENDRKPMDVRALLRNVKALVVDQDSDACAYAAGLLKNFGVRAEWTLSAADALERLRLEQEAGDPFHVVIAGLKLKEMSGIALAREIRKRCGDSVPVALSAYDWSIARREAMEAGARCLFQKPLFPSTIYDFLMSLSQDKPDMPACDAEQQFNGESVLLVEDNDFNLEIAQTLLESRGLSVDTARNGREAVEVFGRSSPGAYLAILMDIQMPLMNGLEASRAIRALDHPDAASVPIIAMSANSYREDIEQSLAAGMNAHISKPIDIPVLFSTLRNLK